MASAAAWKCRQCGAPLRARTVAPAKAHCSRYYACDNGHTERMVEVRAERWDRIQETIAGIPTMLRPGETLETAPETVQLPVTPEVTHTCAERRAAMQLAFGDNFDEDKFKTWCHGNGHDYEEP